MTPAALTVTAANETKTYGAANPALTVTYSGFVNGDTAASLTTPPTCSTTATTASPVGTYPITASGAASHELHDQLRAGTLTVTPAALTVTAANETKAYGAANPTLTVSYSGFVNGDTAASLTTPPTASTTGDGGERGRDLSDHRERRRRAELHDQLRRRHADRDAGGADGDGGQRDEGVRRGEPDADGDLQRLRQRRHVGEPDDAADGATTATAASPVGTYPITASGAASANYTISYVPGTLTVTTAPC